MCTLKYRSACQGHNKRSTPAHRNLWKPHNVSDERTTIKIFRRFVAILQ